MPGRDYVPRDVNEMPVDQPNEDPYAEIYTVENGVLKTVRAVVDNREILLTVTMPGTEDVNPTASLYEMKAGKVTKVKANFQGQDIVLVVADTFSGQNWEIVKAAVEFFSYYNLGATRILFKAMQADSCKSHAVQTEQRDPIAVEMKADVVYTTTGQRESQPTGKRPHRNSGVVETAAKLGRDDVITIYEDNVIKIFVFARDKTNDESIEDPTERSTISLNDIHELFTVKYGKLSPATVRSKATAHLHFMAKSGWLENLQKNPSKPSHYKVLMNPYIDQMPPVPAQSDFKSEDAQVAMANDLDAARRNEDGPKC